jgi:PhzF family phenazine biosynthesis protein
MDVRIFQVDAFTTELFSGNPAAVVPLEEWLDDPLMRRIAAENNLSETAFLARTGADDDHWHIRWFTPVIEVPLCGHATLASAAVIGRYFAPSSWPITLESASGTLMVDAEDDAFILDFPANEASESAMPDELVDALGTAGEECRHADGFYLVTVAGEAELAEISPDFKAIAAFTNDGVIVTARGDSADFVSRFFAPGLGIDEDPVTGAAHCVLTPYWSGRLDKTRLQARQISARGGELGCELRGERVRIGGRVAFYLEGRLFI